MSKFFNGLEHLAHCCSPTPAILFFAQLLFIIFIVKDNYFYFYFDQLLIQQMTRSLTYMSIPHNFEHDHKERIERSLEGVASVCVVSMNPRRRRSFVCRKCYYGIFRWVGTSFIARKCGHPP